MSALERRVQLLLDQTRYDRVEREAQRTSQSVAAVIRAAIDDYFGAQVPGRAAAVERLLATADADDAPGEDWADSKRAIESGLSGRAG